MVEVSQYLFAVGALAVFAVGYVRMYRRARARRARLTSGDRVETGQAVADELERSDLPHAYRAFSLAALGEFTEARRALLAAPSDAGFGARDFELCTEIILAAFEREPDLALAHAVELVQLPVGDDEERQRARRLGVVSLARLLAGVCEEEDWEHFDDAISREPLMLWPCTYAAAVCLRAEGRNHMVEPILRGAPAWSPTSLFAGLHVELTGAPSGRFRKVVAA